MTDEELVYYLAGQGGPAPDGEPWKTVTDAQLKAWTGNFCGPSVPMIAPACPQDPITQINCSTSGGKQASGLVSGVLFSTHFLNYTEAQQDEILATYPGTHFPINCSDTPGHWGYSGIYPPCPSDNPKILNAALKKVWRAGKIPVCIVIGYLDQNTDDAFKVWVKLLDDPLLARIVVPGMEMNDDMSRSQIAAIIQRFAKYLPTALIYVEFTPGHSAGDSPEPDWWGNGWTANQRFQDEDGAWYTHGYDWPGFQNIPQATGLLINDANYDDDERLYNNTGDFLYRLTQGGYWGMKRTIDCILFETVAVPRFWNNRSLSSCDSHNQYTLDRCYHQPYTYRGVTGRLAGYCNGGQ